MIALRRANSFSTLFTYDAKGKKTAAKAYGLGFAGATLLDIRIIFDNED